MPYADFQPSNAGSQAFQQSAQGVELVQSMMDRSLRRQAMLQDIHQSAARFAIDQQLGTQQLQQGQLRIAQMERQGRLDESLLASQVASEKRLTEAANELPSAITALETETDPDKMDYILADYQAKYGKLGDHPVLGQQFGSLIGDLRATHAHRKEAFVAKAMIGASRLDPLLDEADPETLAKNLSTVRNAGDFFVASMKVPQFRSKYDAAQKTVQTYYQKIAEKQEEARLKTVEANAKADADIRVNHAKAEDDTKAAEKAAKSDRELSVPGYEGKAPALEEAKKFREVTASVDKAESSVNRLLEILKTPGKSFSPELRAEAQTEARVLQAAIRPEILGQGAVSDGERHMLESIVTDPTKLWSLDSQSEKSLTTLLTRLKTNRDISAASLGLKRSSTVSGSGVRPVIQNGPDLAAAAKALAAKRSASGVPPAVDPNRD